MTRLGLWGEGVPAFPDFAAFLDAMDSKGVAAFELVAMDMKVIISTTGLLGSHAAFLPIRGWDSHEQYCCLPSILICKLVA